MRTRQETLQNIPGTEKLARVCQYAGFTNIVENCGRDSTLSTQLLHQNATPRHHSLTTRTRRAQSWRSGAPSPWMVCHTGGVPAGHPRYTRAWYAREAVGGSTSRAQKREDHIRPHGSGASSCSSMAKASSHTHSAVSNLSQNQ